MVNHIPAQPWSEHPVPLPSADEPGGRVSCPVCQAVYAPSQTHASLLQAPPVALESALMSMCHFCFRCRRPSCPACWDEIHGICGACVQEVHLPFRKEVPPLQGVLFSPLRQAQQVRETPSAPPPLICVRPGRFQPAVSASVEEIPTRPMQAAATRQPETQPKQAPEQAPFQTSHSSNSGSTRAPALRRRITSSSDIDEIETQPGRSVRTKHKIERVATLVLFILLLVIVVLIIAASVSEEVNVFVAQVLHIDIRAEIAYLWQLITHLHA